MTVKGPVDAERKQRAEKARKIATEIFRLVDSTRGRGNRADDVATAILDLADLLVEQSKGEKNE